MKQSLKNVAVVGGIITLQPQYKRVLADSNLNARIYNRDMAGLCGRVEGVDLIILFSGTVSHRMAIKTRRTAATNGIRLVSLVRSSVSALRKSLSTLESRSVL